MKNDNCNGAQKSAVSGFLLKELEAFLETIPIPGYHARQIALWVHRRRAVSFEGMSDLSLNDRALLKERLDILSSRVGRREEGPDGTIKLLVELADGETVETVLIRDGDRNTVCISTQVGCPIRCVFCASGLNGLVRNLEAGEIVEQALHVGQFLAAEERINNLVIMGIGEPLLNFRNVIKALRIFKASWGMGIGYNRITLSTVGMLDKIDEMMGEGVLPNLAISLHAPNDTIRALLVPTIKVGVTQAIKKGIEYRLETGKDVTFEYVLIAGLNDARRHALELGKKLHGTKCKVNVIPYNPVGEIDLRSPSTESVDRFVSALGGTGVPVMVRKRKGDAINAACGQLRIAARAAAGNALKGGMK